MPESEGTLLKLLNEWCTGDCAENTVIEILIYGVFKNPPFEIPGNSVSGEIVVYDEESGSVDLEAVID